jgi:type VI secretion system protein VasJ
MKSGLHKPALEDGNLEGLKSLIIEKKEIFIDLDKRPFHDHFAAVNYLNRLIKQHNRNAPQAMFLGGTVERSYLALFMRPLTTANFVRLWIAAAESTGG